MLEPGIRRRHDDVPAPVIGLLADPLLVFDVQVHVLFKVLARDLLAVESDGDRRVGESTHIVDSLGQHIINVGSVRQPARESETGVVGKKLDGGVRLLFGRFDGGLLDDRHVVAKGLSVHLADSMVHRSYREVLRKDVCDLGPKAVLPSDGAFFGVVIIGARQEVAENELRYPNVMLGVQSDVDPISVVDDSDDTGVLVDGDLDVLYLLRVWDRRAGLHTCDMVHRVHDDFVKYLIQPRHKSARFLDDLLGLQHPSIGVGRLDRTDVHGWASQNVFALGELDIFVGYGRGIHCLAFDTSLKDTPFIPF